MALYVSVGGIESSSGEDPQSSFRVVERAIEGFRLTTTSESPQRDDVRQYTHPDSFRESKNKVDKGRERPGDSWRLSTELLYSVIMYSKKVKWVWHA